MQGSSVKYITIDADWTDVLENSFGQGGNGDWEYSNKKFPEGIIATSREVKKLGFKLGIWFEFEVTTQAVLRLDRDEKTGLLVCHGFTETMKQSIEIALQSGTWEIKKVFGEKSPVKIIGNVLVIDHVQDFSGFACILKNECYR